MIFSLSVSIPAFNRNLQILLVAFLLCASGISAQAQNLVPNSSFETYNKCPTAYSAIEMWPSFTYVQSWGRPTGATSDYFNVCSTNWYVGVPTNNFGYQQPHSGNAYAGFYAHVSYSYISFYGEYVTTKLTRPMEKDSIYCVSFFVNLASLTTGTTNGRKRAVVKEVGANFSDTLPTSVTYDPLPLPYHVVSDTTILMNDTSKWYEIKGDYRAKGGEQFMTIGTFGNGRPPLTFFNPADTGLPVCYYFVDDVDVHLSHQKDSVHHVVLCTKNVTLASSAPKGPFRWSTGDTTKTIKVSVEGQYDCLVNQGCDWYADHFLVENIPVFDSSIPVRVCDEGKVDTVLISSRTTGPYKWNTGATTRSIRATKFQDYYCDVLENCTYHRDSFFLFGTDIPKPYVADTVVCQHSPAPVLTTTDSNLLWFTQGSGGRGTNTQPPVYTDQDGTQVLYVAIAKDGCVGKRVPVQIVVKSAPEEHSRPEAVTRCLEDQKTLVNLGADEGQGIQYLWSTGDTVCCIGTTGDGVFVCVRTNVCGSATDTFQIRSQRCEDCMSFPDAFTPNNDGRNDRFRPMVRCSVKNFELRICNRWGNTVFFSENPADYWDGSFSGTAAMAGIYMYYATFTSTLTGMKYVLRGDITLIR